MKPLTTEDLCVGIYSFDIVSDSVSNNVTGMVIHGIQVPIDEFDIVDTNLPWE